MITRITGARSTDPAAANRPIVSYIQNISGITVASNSPSTNVTTNTYYSGNETYIHYGGSENIKYYEFGLYYSDIGHINAVKIQNYYMNKYYRPMAATNISYNGEIISWSDNTYNSSF